MLTIPENCLFKNDPQSSESFRSFSEKFQRFLEDLGETFIIVFDYYCSVYSLV